MFTSRTKTIFRSALLNVALVVVLGACNPPTPPPPPPPPSPPPSDTLPPTPPLHEVKQSPLPAVQTVQPTLIVVGVDDTWSMKNCLHKDLRYQIPETLLKLMKQYFFYLEKSSVEIEIVSFPSKKNILPRTDLSSIGSMPDSPGFLYGTMADEAFSYINSAQGTGTPYIKKILILLTDGDFRPERSLPPDVFQEEHKKNRERAQNAFDDLDTTVEVFPVLLCQPQDKDDNNFWEANFEKSGRLSNAYETDGVENSLGNIWQKIFNPLLPQPLSASPFGGIYILSDNSAFDLNTGQTSEMQYCPQAGSGDCLPVDLAPNASEISAGAIWIGEQTLSPILLKDDEGKSLNSNQRLGEYWKSSVAPIDGCKTHRWAFNPDLKADERVLIWWRASGMSFRDVPIEFKTTEIHYYGDTEINARREEDRMVRVDVQVSADLSKYISCYQIGIVLDGNEFARRPLMVGDNAFELGDKFSTWTGTPNRTVQTQAFLTYSGDGGTEQKVEKASEGINLRVVYIPGFQYLSSKACHIWSDCQIEFFTYYAPDVQESEWLAWIVFPLSKEENHTGTLGPACKPGERISYPLTEAGKSEIFNVTKIKEKAGVYKVWLTPSESLYGCNIRSFYIVWDQKAFSLFPTDQPDIEQLFEETVKLSDITRAWHCLISLNNTITCEPY